MHRTQALGYGVVLVGKVELTLDNGEMRFMKAGGGGAPADNACVAETR